MKKSQVITLIIMFLCVLIMIVLYSENTRLRKLAALSESSLEEERILYEASEDSLESLEPQEPEVVGYRYYTPISEDNIEYILLSTGSEYDTQPAYTEPDDIQMILRRIEEVQLIESQREPTGESSELISLSIYYNNGGVNHYSFRKDGEFWESGEDDSSILMEPQDIEAYDELWDWLSGLLQSKQRRLMVFEWMNLVNRESMIVVKNETMYKLFYEDGLYDDRGYYVEVITMLTEKLFSEVAEEFSTDFNLYYLLYIDDDPRFTFRVYEWEGKYYLHLGDWGFKLEREWVERLDEIYDEVQSPERSDVDEEWFRPRIAYPATAKPVIYLYPEEETEVTVQVNFDGEISYTYPSYGRGWTVTAYPDGRLVNHGDGEEYYYLFWEGHSSHHWNMEEGFVVKREEMESFLREKLAYMGLLPREYHDFIVYWVPMMQDAPYYFIHFSTMEEYGEVAKLDIQPQPDSILRIHMAWRPLEGPGQAKEQVIQPFSREGFTVVEWGGTGVNGQ